MILQSGEKILVIHRQLFERDPKRHFIGTVEQCEGVLVRVKGYLFAMDTRANEFVKRSALRTRIVALDDELIVNVLPSEVDIEKMHYHHKAGGDTVLTDGSSWHLELTHL